MKILNKPKIQMLTVKHKIPIMFLICCFISLGITYLTSNSLNIYRFFYILSLELIILSLVPRNPIHKTTVGSIENTRKFKIINLVLLIATILVIIGAMSANPLWDGHVREQLNQYEELSQSLAERHLYIDHGDLDPKLLTLKDPYDKNQRDAVHATMIWDHSLFNGHYYMYFGVIPCLLFFLPFLLITGHILPTLTATMFITILTVSGLFMLFRTFTRKYWDKMSLAAYGGGFLGLTALSIWWIVKAPALYCTAIVSGICFAVWGLYFIYKSLVVGNSSNKSFWIYLTVGSLFSAFTFGCRPPIGLFFVVYIPILIKFIRKNNWKTNLKVLICLMIPFIAVALGLMWYNYVRFFNPFEFGQAYQLTVTDQSSYEKKGFSISSFIKFIGYEFFYIRPISSDFPFINISGPFLYVPVILLGLVLLLNKKVILAIKSAKIEWILLTLVLSIFLIIGLQSVWSPIPLPRYTMDFNFIIAIIVMILMRFKLKTTSKVSKINLIIYYLSLIIIFVAVLFYFGNYDNPIQEGNPELFKMIKDTVMLGFLY